jgi:quinol monooxygenase YgiN
MSDQVSWIIKMNIKSGKITDFKALMSEMVEATKTHEEGAESYEWYFNETETECHIYEKYKDSQATMTHLGAFGENFAGRFMTLVEPTGITIYGTPNEDVKTALKDFGPAFLTHVGGFTR